MNKNKFSKIILCSLIICALIFTGFFIASKMYITETALSKKAENGDVNILFMATDKGGFLTDTIMLASVSEKSKMINILSIPRDTRVSINGSNRKINSAYGVGNDSNRINLPIELIEGITGIDINYYAVVNPNVVVEVIDKLGGVEINVPQRMYYVDPTQDLYIDLYPGLQVLDGAKSEQFLRFRSGYANADLGRISAQQMFVKELIRQKASANYISKIPDIFSSVSKNLNTDLMIEDILTIVKMIKTTDNFTINSYQLPGAPNSLYFVHDPEKTQELVENVFVNHIIPEESDGN